MGRQWQGLVSLIGLLALAALACGSLPGQTTQPLAPTADMGAPTAVSTPTPRPTSTPDPLATPTPRLDEVSGLPATPTLAAPGGGSGPGGSGPGDSSGSSPGNNGGTATPGNSDSPPPADEGGSGAPVAVSCPAAGTNRLQQGSFEGPFEPFSFINELNVPPPWVPWYEDDGRVNFRPEYKPADGVNFPNRVRSGQSAQAYFKSYGQFLAGLYQQVVNIQPGSRLQFSAWGQGWSCEDFSQCGGGVSYNPANMLMRVGIDPYGGRSHLSRNIVWSDYFNPIDRWEVKCVETVAMDSVVTVFLWASPNGPRQNQDVYWDDASLVVLP
jgi:hypothetical protein